MTRNIFVPDGADGPLIKRCFGPLVRDYTNK